MAKPQNKPTIIVPVERQNSGNFGRQAVDAIRQLPNFNQFVNDSVAFQSGIVLTPKIVNELQKAGNPLAVNTNAGRVVIARSGGGYTTIDNRYPENDGGFTLRNQMLYSETSDLVRDFVIDDDLTDGSSNDRFARFAKGERYRSIRMAGIPPVDPSNRAARGDPSIIQMPTAARGLDLIMNMAVIVPDGGNFIFSAAGGSNAFTISQDYVRISTIGADPGQRIWAAVNNNENVGNIAVEDRINSSRNFLFSRMGNSTTGGLYFIRMEATKGTTENVRVTASRFNISDVAIAFDSTNGFGSLDASHPNYIGTVSVSSSLRTDVVPRVLQFSSHERVASEILFYQLQVGSAFNVIR